MPAHKRIVVIDARPLARGKGGIQRYLSRLLPYLIDNNNFEIILYSDKPVSGLTKKQLNNVKLRTVNVPVFSPMLWHMVVPVWLRVDRPSVYWSPRHHLPFLLPSKCKNIVTIHDFVWKTVPKTMPMLKRLTEQILMPRAILNSDQIICISKTTQAQLKNYFPGSEQKSVLILHGHDQITKMNLEKPLPSQNYFLAVGTLEPRKNYERLLAAFSLYTNSGGKMRLVIVGKKGWRFKNIFNELHQMKVQNQIDIFTDVTDSQLHEYYQNTCGFVSISLDEGYGLPPQEAQQYGLPLLLSRIDVYCELYPNADLWVNPSSISNISYALHELEQLSLGSKTQHACNTSSSWQTCATSVMYCFSIS